MAPKTYRLSTNGTWSSIKNWYRLSTNGSWTTVKKIYRLATNGNWQLVFSSSVSPSISSQVSISVGDPNAINGLRTLTGTNKYWTDYSTIDYTFYKSSDGVSYSGFASGTATNPSSSGQTTQDLKTLENNGSQVLPNITNYYKYGVEAYNSTYGTTTTSMSSAVTVEGARDISNLATSGATTSSINLSWTAGSYNSSYYVQYSADSGFSYATTIQTSSTSITISGLSPATTYYFKVKPYTGSLVSGAVTGYAGNFSSSVSGTTSTPPTLSQVTGFQVYNYNPNTGEIQVKWNAVTNATDYYVSYYIGATFIEGAYTAGGLTWTPTAYLSENTTYTFYVYPIASGYYSPSAVSLSYTTPSYPARPTDYNWSSDSSSITINNFVGGNGWRWINLYKYTTVMSAPVYQTFVGSTSSSISFTGLSPGSAYDILVYGYSMGIVNGVSTPFLSSGATFPYGRYIVTTATALPASGTNTQFTAGGVGTTAIGYTRIPASLPSQVQYFAMVLFKWNGSYYAYQATRFHRIDGNSFEDDYAHLSYYSGSTMNGFFLSLTTGYYLVECRTYNNQGYDTAGSGYQYITL